MTACAEFQIQEAGIENGEAQLPLRKGGAPRAMLRLS
jgi:hypothetical protein